MYYLREPPRELPPLREPPPLRELPLLIPLELLELLERETLVLLGRLYPLDELPERLLLTEVPRLPELFSLRWLLPDVLRTCCSRR